MNVEKTKKSNLCVSCEACKAICPNNAIEMKFERGQYLPEINKNKCTDCSLCYKICPGIDINKERILNKEFSVDEIAGHCEATYIVSYENEEVRKNGASGGAVTGLLIEMLRNKEIEGAFVLGSDGTNEKIARVSYVEKELDLINSAKSKYIPASIYDVIKKIKKEPEKKYAIVGTSCQFSAIRKFLKTFNIKNDRIVFLGLFCDRTLNYNILEYFKDVSGNSGNKLIKVDFRNKEKNGWPGDIKLYFENKKEIFVSRKKRVEVKDFFQLNRCSFCFDKLNRDADISFGDCYIKREGSEDGKTNLIIRTEKGLEIFEKFKDRFETKEIDVEEIINSQRLELRREIFEKIKNFPRSNNFDFRKMKIFIGASYPFTKILLGPVVFLEKNLKKSGLLIRLMLAGCRIFFEIIKHSFSYFFGKFSPEKNEKLDKIIILGGGMENKGAQAMTFIVMDKARIKNPNCKIYLMSNAAFFLNDEEKRKYNLEIMPWGKYEKLEIFFRKNNLFKKYNINNKYKKDIFDTFSSTDCIFDISGYGISSQFGLFASLSYILKIIIAKKFFKPFYLLPQSFGPYSYKFPSNLVMKSLLNIYLKYPIKIFARENDGYYKTLEFTKKNVEKSYDLVIRNKEYNIQNIFSKNYKLKKIDIKNNSVGIVPNMQVMRKMKWSSDEFYELYKYLISKLLLKDKNVYLIKHSSEDDEINNKIKRFFPLDNKVMVINENLNAIELEYIINQLDYIIASRYHSVVHAYKNGVPAIVIGWAIKYKELLETFGQEKYLFDCRNNLNKEDILDAVSLININYSAEKEKINLGIKAISNNSIYNKVFKIYNK